MASFRDIYTREVESLFERLRKAPFKPDNSPSFVPWQDPTQTGNLHPTGFVAPGAIDLAQFAAGIIPPRVVDELPTLPDTDYAQGSLVFLTTDEKLYRNTDGSTWSLEVDGADIADLSITADKIVANSLTAGQIQAGAIGTDELAADAVIANVLNAGGTVTIDSNGITLLDASGMSVLTSSGFDGSWVDFLSTGIYNGTWRAYSALNTRFTDVTEVSGGDTTADYLASLSPDVPMWVVSKCDDGVMTGDAYYEIRESSGIRSLRLGIDSFPSGGEAGVWLYTDVPVSRGLAYDIYVESLIDVNGAGTPNISFHVSADWRDADHGPDAAATLEGTYSKSGGSSSLEDDRDLLLRTDTNQDAAYLRVYLKLGGISSAGQEGYVDIYNVSVKPATPAHRLEAGLWTVLGVDGHHTIENSSTGMRMRLAGGNGVEVVNTSVGGTGAPALVVTEGGIELDSRQMSGAAPVRRVYTSTSGSTWTKPAGLSHIEVECVGGGGGGGGCAATSGSSASAGCGGGGGYARKLFLAADLPATCTADAGAAGAGGAAGNNNGGGGGSSTFSGSGITTVNGNGGSGGSGAANPGAGANARESGGLGGGASGGDINIAGGDGAGGTVVSGAPSDLGVGGSSYFGGGGHKTNSTPQPGGQYGGGGGGATRAGTNSALAGAAGFQGVVIVTEYYLS